MKITKNDLALVETPERTATWNPIPHYDIVNIIDEQLEKSNLTVLRHDLEITKQKSRLFGAVTLQSPADTKTQFMLGYRNAVDKSLALGFCGGLRVVVCSNMMFSGEYITFRKHTGRLCLDEVVELTQAAIAQLPAGKASFDDMLSAYAKVPLNNASFQGVIWDLMVADILKPSEFNRYLECIEIERENNNGQTLATVYNAFTRLYREKPLHNLMTTTPQLTAITYRYAA